MRLPTGVSLVTVKLGSDQVVFAATTVKHKSKLSWIPAAVVGDGSKAGARIRQTTS
jgi:hypothetical protein